MTPEVPASPAAGPGRPARLGLLASMRFLLDPLRLSPVVHARGGPLVRLADAAGGMTLVFEPSLVREVLTQTDTFEHLDSDTVPVKLPKDSASYRLTTGLLAFQNGDRHRALRRELMPAFDQKHLQNYHALARASTRDFIAGLEARPGTLDLNRICHEVAMNTALLTLFGIRLGPEARTLAAAIRAWMEAGFSPWTLLLPFDLPGTSYRRFLRAGVALESLLHAMFRAGPQSQDPLVKVVFGEGWKQGELPPELVSRASGYMQASYETTSNTLIWTLVLLNLHPEAAERAAREVDEALGGRDIEYADLGGLAWLRACVLEAIRMLPPLTFFPRRVTREVTLGGVRFRAGERLAYGPILTHRLPHVFPRPLAFDPGRFLGTGRGEGFLGFGGGPRRCPGEQFGLNEVLLILATWLRRGFPRIEDGARIDARGVVILTPTGTVPFRHVPRGEWRPERARLSGSAVAGIGA